MLRLHGYATSINVRKVLWLCAELGLDVELIDRGTATNPVDDPVFVRLNPFGLVPVLDDGGYILPESNTILRYLCRREQRADLLPQKAVAAANVERWIDWQATDFNDSWRYAFLALVRKRPGFDDPELINRSIEAFDAKAKIVEEQLAKTGGHIADKEFTLADIPIGLSLRRWFAMAVDRRDLPNVRHYYERLCERPSFLSFGGPDAPA
ncbi:glutathione S-transferase N-terminal domain-containing protein [uncultured Sphingorhabdus sp.]|uniref:glutathione S-transferase family protein n=1 Tax=uncultured Sphingorhabdus sp. TaxID=1686106 RepID=UPI002615D139|nr:glutathione S-transferase N-terminal domain-containing protein [uncultured Sphingorhabdus sp.]HMS21285.1 glutathione S-transferase N-terminal domain-containing protein [Sphingorhabdus sp.]